MIRLAGEPVAELTDDRLQFPRERPRRRIGGEQSLRRGRSILPQFLLVDGRQAPAIEHHARPPIITLSTAAPFSVKTIWLTMSWQGT